MDGNAGRILKGVALSSGLGEGRAVLYRSARPAEVVPRVPDDLDVEVCGLEAAIETARRDVERIRLRVQADIGADEAEIFAAHEALLGDAEFIRRIRERVRGDRVSSEQAVEAEVAASAQLLASVEDPGLRERSADLRDVGRRLLNALARRPSTGIEPLAPGSVLIAVELLPSETVYLDRSHVAAIVTEVGGETSHVAILARSLGIPAVTAVQGATNTIRTGDWVRVDGERGEVRVAAAAAARRRAFSPRRPARARAPAQVPESVTRDGEFVVLRANLGRAEEAHEARAHQLAGVGLLRTEFLFLDSRESPGFERQAAVYRQVSRAIGGLPLTIRTLDLGGDKIPLFLPARAERNPSLGLRGLRFSLHERQLFETQLRAIVDTAEVGPVRVLFPMVLGTADLCEAKARLQEVVDRVQGAAAIEVGAMIETPTAVFLIDEILDEVDFVSLGTNDLTQFVLAADRDAVGLLEDYSVLHPSVLRAIARVVAAARAKGRPLSVCGEAAGDPATTALLVGLGVRELSMSPLRAARVRAAIRCIICRDAEALAQAALLERSTDRVRARLASFMSNLPEAASGAVRA